MEQNRPRLSSAISFMLLIGGLIFWWVNSIPNEDALWFLRSFSHKADWITIYWDGETHVLLPKDPGYDMVMNAFSDAIAHWSGYESGTGLSDENMNILRSDGRLLELHFNTPVKVHTRHLFSEARFFYVPLSGSHTYYQRVFSGLLETPRAGVLNMDEARYETLLDNIITAIGATPE